MHDRRRRWYPGPTSAAAQEPISEALKTIQPTIERMAQILPDNDWLIFCEEVESNLSMTRQWVQRHAQAHKRG